MRNFKDKANAVSDLHGNPKDELCVSTTIETLSSVWHTFAVKGISNTLFPDLVYRAEVAGLSEIDNRFSESLEFKFDMYPNPSNGFLTVDVAGVENGNAILYITNTAGRQVKVEKLLINGENNFRTIDLTDLKKGLYILQFNNGMHHVNKKLILK